jgi:hypothetical protein
MNENEQRDTKSEVVRVYEEMTAVDNSAVYTARLKRLSGFAVTPENVDEAKKVRAALNGLKDDAAAARMTVQRAIKAHPIGKFAFNKTDLEMDIEKEAKRLGAEIDKVTNAPRIQFREDVQTFVCFVTGTLAQINKLAVTANEQGLQFENRGPLEDGAANGTQPIL